MVIYCVSGVDRITGKDRSEVIEAEGEDQARAEAVARGLMVEKLVARGQTAKPTPPAPPIQDSANPPAYSGLTIGAAGVRVASMVYVGFGLLGLAGAAFTLWNDPDKLYAMRTAGPILVGSLLTFGVAGVLFAVASACHALRDIARNSHIQAFGRRL